MASVGVPEAIRTYQRATLIFNPNAGRIRRHSKLIDAVCAALNEGGHTVFRQPTAGPGNATAIARQAVENGADIVLAAGGDGTINEVLNGMVGSRVPLGILPAGTANVLAMEMGMGSNAVRAARDLSASEPLRISVGLLRNLDGSPRRHFLLMAGAGLDAHIVANLDPSVKNRFGKGAYWAAGFQSLRRRLEEFDAIIDGTRRRCSFSLVSRVRNYGGDLEICRNASLLKDHFDVMLFEGSNPFRYLGYFAGVLTATAARVPGITSMSARAVCLQLASGGPVLVQADGEDCGEVPVQIEIVPDALTLLMPCEFAERERRRWTI